MGPAAPPSAPVRRRRGPHPRFSLSQARPAQRRVGGGVVRPRTNYRVAPATQARAVESTVGRAAAYPPTRKLDAVAPVPDAAHASTDPGRGRASAINTRNGRPPHVFRAIDDRMEDTSRLPCMLWRRATVCVEDTRCPHGPAPLRALAPGQWARCGSRNIPSRNTPPPLFHVPGDGYCQASANLTTTDSVSLRQPLSNPGHFPLIAGGFGLSHDTAVTAA